MPTPIKHTRQEARAMGYVCPHCRVLFKSHETEDGRFIHPNEGDCGICSGCRYWWVMKDAVLVKYTPNEEDMAVVKGRYGL